MSNEKELNKRLKQELELIEKQKEKNKLRAKESEQAFIKNIVQKHEANKIKKYKASIYTSLTVFAFLINPVFGAFIFFAIIIDIIFNPFKW